MALPRLRVSPAGTHLPAEVTDLVASWAPSRRWFPGMTGRPTAWLEITSEAAPDVVLALLRREDTVLQVPLVAVPLGASPSVPEVGDASYIGAAAGFTVYDGGAHPAAWDLLLRAAGFDDPDVTGGRTLAGEQSNTSVVLPRVRADGADHGSILKILRTVPAGEHPDVTVPQALTGAGFTGVPRFLGAAAVSLAPQGPDLVHLAVLSALVPEAQDGFELACRHAGRGEPFAALAGELGTVVAHLHEALRTALPVEATLDPATFVTGLRRRAAAALVAAPQPLTPHSDAIGAVLDDLERRLAAVPLQRIHGDLNLGQALHGGDGWQLLDFEGEPQRPVEDRTAPDLPLRDVAGMLRSFDYAAAVGSAPDPTWASDAQAAFLGAYRAAAPAGAGTDDTGEAVLRALVLDKALYEVVYETRQRPQWVHIPLGAVEGLVSGV